MTNEEKEMIKSTASQLEKLYPQEANYGSRASMWGCGFRDGVITQKQYTKASEYYGSLWFYVGD